MWVSVRGRVVGGCGYTAACLGAVVCVGSSVGMFSRPHVRVCVCVEEAALGWQLGALNPSFTHTLIESQASGEGREGGQWV